MPRRVFLVFLVAAVCLTLGLSASSAQKKPSLTRVANTPVMDPIPIGPGGGGVGVFRGSPARFVGVTTQRFPVGAGALGVSRACNTEHPVSRLCEWAEIFRALPPITLDSEVLVAPNYEINPVPVCLNPNGGLNCRTLAQRLPAACCGYPVPTDDRLAELLLSIDGNSALVDCSDTFFFTATALDVQANPVGGIQVVFEIVPIAGGAASVLGTLTPTFAISDVDGNASSALSLNSASCAERCTGGQNCSIRVRVRDLGALIVSTEVEVVDQIP